MSDPLGQFDWTQADPEHQLMNLAKALGVEVKATDLAFQAILTPEQLEAYVTLRTLLRDKAQVQGAQRAFKAADKRKRQMVHEVRQMKSQVAALQKRDAAQAAEIARLQARVTGQAQHLTALQQARAPRPAPVPQEAPSALPERPQWDYTPVQRRRPQRGEVVTDSPFGVEVVARHVEEYVRKNGPCKKPDVSAALPTCRPYLSDAYRHLHSSKRVHVDGWSLKMWPTNG